MKNIIVILIGICFQAVFISFEHRKKYSLALLFKCLASCMFVLLGYWAYSANGDTFSLRIFIGLILGLVGDFFMNLRFLSEKNGQKIFLIGIVAFLAGHIAYLVAITANGHNTILCAVIGAILAACLLAYIFKTMDVKLSFKIFGVFYLGAIFIMTSIAIGIAIVAPTTASVMFAIGAISFTASDIVLIFNTFSGKPTRFSLRIANLSLYYAGQILIAMSLFNL